ncbi:26.2 kDa heat shock protein mitochondrial [Phtheirospermum japonicum]|uniref:26.2 kDa heat shock protein mitochondrial n=1 Tax=Phtheirospermum japonicum TaxID=374723 RepID=A0A830DGP5_9LAMI|nr:26.2 kDa heat shock protein mitochondrial [Phtheirospermum japonicum]
MKGKDTFYGVFLRVDMPGVGKESVKVRIEKDTVIMKGEGQKDFEDDELGPRYYFSIQLPIEQYNTDGVKANMVNGVLKVFVPKFKLKERTNLLHVTVF